jgi:hypothetical protein
MTTTTAFVPSIGSGEEDPQWEQVPDPPYVASYGRDDFVWFPDRPGLRGYVNGVRVVGGLQSIEPGDFVRIHEKGKETFFRFAGRSTADLEPGQGRRCAFTRMVIEGQAVRCSVCERVVSERVAQQIGLCICGAPLGRTLAPELPTEEQL